MAHNNEPRKRVSITGITSDIRTKYHIQTGEIGHGHYGTVRKCSDRETGEVFAVKTIKKEKVGRIDSLRREIQILQAVDHPNIIKLYDIYEDDKYLHLVMELCEGGELFDRIIAKTQSAEGHYSEVECAKLVQKILRAINYCHTIHNICHRDLKPENFIFKTKAEDSEMKIIDFGLSRYEDEAGSKMTTRVGTPYYISPEVLARRYDKACDLWSIGVITYILICGYPPFYGDTDAEIFESVRKGRFTFPSPEWDDITRPAKTFIKSLLNKDPTARPTAEQALQHEWLARTLSAGFEARPFNFAQMNTALRQFMGMSNLKKVALNVIAHQTAEADVAHLTALFEALDQDGNGVITVDELQGALGRAGASPRTSQGLSAALRAADIDASDALDYREFLAATMDQRVYTQEGNLRKAFRYFDLGRTGCITREDLVRIFGSEEQAHQILGDVDRDQDGQISYEEFKRMMVESFTPRRHPGAVAGATGAFFQGPAIASGGGGGGMAQAAADPNRATPGVLSNTPKNPGSRRRPAAVALGGGRGGAAAAQPAEVERREETGAGRPDGVQLGGAAGPGRRRRRRRDAPSARVVELGFEVGRGGKREP